MAIGRISGSVLKSNLTRNGTDLAFETNLLYLDVTNSRVGIGTSEPSTALHVNGTVTASAITGLSSATIANTSTGDSLLVTTTENSSTAGPVISLKRNSGSPADADYLGQIKFKGENDADQEVNYAKITGKILDASDGTEDGIIEFAHVKAGSQTITGRWRSDSLQLLNSTNLSVAGDTTVTGTLSFSGITLPSSDGSNGQVLQTNGSAVLSFGSASATGAFTAFEYTATAAQTSFSGNDDNSNSLAYTAGVSNVFVSVNGVMLDGSDYTATNGTAVVLSAAASANDMIKILATSSSNIAATDP